MSASEFEDIPLEGVEEPATLRQSLLTMFDLCSYGGALYVKGQPPGHQLYRGSALHEAWDLIVKTLTAEGEKTMAPDDGKAILEEVIRAHPTWIIPAKELDGMRLMMHNFCTHFVLPEGALSEVPYRVAIAGKVCTGTIDLLWVDGDTCHVNDWKSGFNLYGQDEVSGKDSNTGVQRGARAAQLIQYALGVADGECEDFKLPRGVNYFNLAFRFPMFADPSYGIAERGVIVSRPELIEHRTWLEMLVTRVGRAFGEGRFTAVPGSHCTRCPDQSACPIPTKAKGTGPFENDPVAVAEEWFRKKAEVDRLFSELKGYVKAMGPVEFGTDQVLDLQQVVSTKTPPKVKARVLAGEVVSPDEMYQPSFSTRFVAKKRA